MAENEKTKSHKTVNKSVEKESFSVRVPAAIELRNNFNLQQIAEILSTVKSPLERLKWTWRYVAISELAKADNISLRINSGKFETDAEDWLSLSRATTMASILAQCADDIDEVLNKTQENNTTTGENG